MRITKVQIAAALLGLSFAGCRGSDNKGNPDAAGPIDGTIDTPSGEGGLKIQDIQDPNGSVKDNGAVAELKGVIVTAVDTFGNRTGDLFVQQPGGGPYSGVKVFGASVTDLGKLTAGDIVTITGALKSEFVLKNMDGSPQDTSGRTTTELVAASKGSLAVAKTGHTDVPAPYALDANALDAMAQGARDAELEKWEGVLVTVSNVRSRTLPIGFGSRPYPADSYKANITANLVAESTMSPFVGVDGLACFAKMTGPIDYFFGWLLLPRSADDVMAGSACTPVPVTDSTISAIQGAPQPPTGAVKITDVYVTAKSNNGQSFWASTTPTAAPNEGIFVFQSASMLPLTASVVVGAKVTVTGNVTEFNDDTMGDTLTEFGPLRYVVSTDEPVAITAVSGKTVAELLDPATAKTYESVLVTLDNVAITAVGASANGFIATGKQAGTEFKIGTDIVQLKGPNPPTDPTGDLACYKTVTGLWTTLEIAGATTKPNSFGFIVRTLGTKGAATDCN